MKVKKRSSRTNGPGTKRGRREKATKEGKCQKHFSRDSIIGV